jgi:nucleotide-binding universal stress UspA family protein
LDVGGAPWDRKKHSTSGKECGAHPTPSGYALDVKTILVPIDFSGVSETVIAEAAALTRAVKGRLVLLNVIAPPIVETEYTPYVGNLAEITAAGEKHAAKRLAGFEQQLSADSFPVESIQLEGAPIPNIVEQAKQLRADYIVMGSHGHRALYDLLVGSTTHGVLLRAKCPVVIIPPSNRTTA